VATEQSLKPGRVVARLARQLEVALARVDLTVSQYRVLAILDAGVGGLGPTGRGEGASVLADKLGVTRPSITGVVDGLVLRGLVERHPEGSDRRRIGVVLTAEGRRLLADADAEAERRLTEIAEELGPARRPDAISGLAGWQEALDGYRARKLAAAPVEVSR
jgi:long-chain acyl-CoA synthetase